MQTTIEFIDAVKKRYSIKSDYGLVPILGITRSVISSYRLRGVCLGEETALKVAEILELEPGYVLACVAAERAKLSPVREAWQSVAKKMSAAAIAAFIGVSALMSPAPAPASTVPAFNTGYTLYAIRRRALVALMGLFVLLWAFSAKAGDNWTKDEKIAEGVFFFVDALDWQQTRTIARHPEAYAEVNPLLGRHPSVGRVNLWCAATALGHLAIADALPHRWRRIWIGAHIVFEANLVAHNAALGLRIGF